MRTVTFLTAAVTLAITAGTGTRAQADDGLETTAMAVEGYETSQAQCYYAPVVKPALSLLADHFAASDPYRWKRAVQEVAGSAQILKNFGKMPGGGPTINLGGDKAPPRPVAPPNPNMDCVSIGLAVGMALPYAAMMSEDPRAVFEEANRLISAKGRLRAQGE